MGHFHLDEFVELLGVFVYLRIQYSSFQVGSKLYISLWFSILGINTRLSEVRLVNVQLPFNLCFRRIDCNDCLCFY